MVYPDLTSVWVPTYSQPRFSRMSSRWNLADQEAVLLKRRLRANVALQGRARALEIPLGRDDTMGLLSLSGMVCPV